MHTRTHLSIHMAYAHALTNIYLFQSYGSVRAYNIAHDNAFNARLQEIRAELLQN